MHITSPIMQKKKICRKYIERKNAPNSVLCILELLHTHQRFYVTYCEAWSILLLG